MVAKIKNPMATVGVLNFVPQKHKFIPLNHPYKLILVPTSNSGKPYFVKYA